MTVEKEKIRKLFQDFTCFLATKNDTFKSFKSSAFVDRHENYKYEVYDEAKRSLEQHWWKPTDIGTGKIQKKVKEAIKTKLIYRYQWHDNNLIDWRKRDDFVKLKTDKSLETTLFNFYKNKLNDSIVFEEFLKLGLSYQLIAYLYFIKDKNQYLPIAQERFDEIFELIGIVGFKTSGNASWANYKEYINLIKQVKDVLKEKDPDVTLLDAHSFLYILGSQMQKEQFSFSSDIDTTVRESSVLDNHAADSRIPLEPLQSNSLNEETEVFLHDEKLAEELPSETLNELFEGTKMIITINAYERNTKARQLCIEYWKPICAVCDFDFEKTYGDLGKDFIHVHHLIPLSQIGGTYKVNPMDDLRPVCPNCHAMLHRREPVLTIETLKSIIAANTVTFSKQ